MLYGNLDYKGIGIYSMNLTFSQHGLWLTMMLVLTGCGGGGSSSTDSGNNGGTSPVKPTDPTTPTNPTNPEEPLPSERCALSYGHWKLVKNQQSIDQTNQVLNCTGQKSTETINSASGETVQYIWGKDLENPTVVAVYQDQKLVSTTYFPPKTDASICVTTQESLDKLVVGQSIGNVETTLSCKGIQNFSVSSGNSSTIYSSYTWLMPNKTDKLTLVFDQNTNLYSINKPSDSSTESSTCSPNYETWQTVFVGEDSATANNKFKCQGIKDAKNDTLVWGKPNLQNDQSLISLKDDKIVSKAFVGKDQQSCVPSLNQWQSILTNSSYLDVEKILGCKGGLQAAQTTSSNHNYVETNYVWKNFPSDTLSVSLPVGGIYHQVSFKGDQMDSKIYYNNVQPFTSCMPTQEGFAKINLGDQWSSVKNAFTCLPKLTAAVEQNNQQTQQYSWGYLQDGKVTTYAYVQLDAKGQVQEKFIQFSPKPETITLTPTETIIPDPTDPLNPHYPYNPNHPVSTIPGTGQNNGQCSISNDQWLDLANGDSRIQVEGKLNCNGFKVLEDNSQNGKIEQYKWGNDLKHPNVIIHFTNGNLSSKVFYSNQPDTQICAAFPSQDKIDALKNGQTRTEVENIIGCQGIYQYRYSEGGHNFMTVYLWQRPQSDETLTLNFNQEDKLLSSSHTKATTVSTCTADFNVWDRIGLMYPYTQIQSLFGCAGVNNASDAQIKEWGASDRSQNKWSIGFGKDNYVYEKRFIAKDAISTCPVKEYATWQNIAADSSYANIKTLMQCDGVFQTAYTKTNRAQDVETTYSWKNILNQDRNIGMHAQQMFFVGDQLKQKVYLDYQQPFSSCDPQQQDFDSIKLGDEWSKVQNNLGCAAKLSYANQQFGTSALQEFEYSWGHWEKNVETTSAQVYVDGQGKVIKKYIYFATK